MPAQPSSRSSLEPLLQFLCDGNQSAAVLCDSKLRIIVANDSARDLACESAPFTMRAGVLQLCGFGAAATTQRAILMRYGEYVHRVSCSLGAFTLRALHIRLDGGLPTLIALRVMRDDGERGIGADSLTAILTRAERDVAVHLFEGLSLNDVAVRRGVSINTVKTQARALQSKLHVRTRARLIRRLCETRVVSSGLHPCSTPSGPGAPGRTHRPSAPSFPCRRTPRPNKG
jgi:DNA-binding NarL/FixJ family response regulator